MQLKMYVCAAGFMSCSYALVSISIDKV